MVRYPSCRPTNSVEATNSDVSTTQNVGGGYFGANINVRGAKTQDVCKVVRRSFTVVNLHDLRSNYPLVYDTL